MYLTFDDGPIPEATPWILDTLARYNVKATFFMVGENALRHPLLLERIKSEGHSWGNHTMHHIQGIKTGTFPYVRDVTEADLILDTPLFRPPHGLLKWRQAATIKTRYDIVMYDLVTRDYARKITPVEILENVKRYARNGSIIVFHDSLKSIDKLHYALPRAIEWLKAQGYDIEPIPMH